MRESREIMADLARTGLSPDQLAMLMELSAALTAEARPIEVEARSKGADRTARWRERHKASQNVTERHEKSQSVTAPPETKVSPKPLSKTQTPAPPYNPPPPRQAPPAEPFATFWASYPNKTAKRAAAAAFAKAVKRIDAPEPVAVMLAGIGRAKRTRKWRDGFIPNPATWLNGDCWLDDPEGLPRPEPPTGPADPAVQAEREQHFRQTGEWRSHWGPRPRQAA